MKFTWIFFLVCCFVSLNGQKNYYTNGNYRQQLKSPAAFYFTVFQPFHPESNYEVFNDQHNQQVPNNFNSLMQDDTLEGDQESDAIPRGKSQNRLFFGRNPFLPSPPSSSSRPYFITITSTVLQTISSIATVASKRYF